MEKRETRRNQWKFSARDFPKAQQLSLMGLESSYSLNYDAARAYVIDLAARRLRAAQKKSGKSYLTWNEATDVADSGLLHTLHCYNYLRCAKECPPWVVYVRSARAGH